MLPNSSWAVIVRLVLEVVANVVVEAVIANFAAVPTTGVTETVALTIAPSPTLIVWRPAL